MLWEGNMKVKMLGVDKELQENEGARQQAQTQGPREDRNVSTADHPILCVPQTTLPSEGEGSLEKVKTVITHPSTA